MPTYRKSEFFGKNKPNLFIVGAPKCGTTSLYYYLKQHPDIYFPDKKEPHFFASDLHRASDKYHKDVLHFQCRDIDEYLSLFEFAADEKIIGEASTSYLYSKEAARNIYDLNPDAKIIICLRDPFKQLISWHSYLHFCLEETESDFLRALSLEKKRIKFGRDGSYTTALQHPERLSYSKTIQFDKQIERYLKCFPRKQIQIIILDDLKRDSITTYKNILEFLDIDSDFEPNYEIQNALRVRRYPVLTWFQREVINYLSHGSKSSYLKRLLPLWLKGLSYKMVSNVNGLINRVNTSNTRSNPEFELSDLEPAMRELILYQIDTLSEITNCDLYDLWGYARR